MDDLDLLSDQEWHDFLRNDPTPPPDLLLSAYERTRRFPFSSSREWGTAEQQNFGDEPMGPYAHRVRDYLESLQEGLADGASGQDWRVTEEGALEALFGYLLVPCKVDGRPTVVRGYRLCDHDHYGGPEAPYNDFPWVDRGSAEWHDVPSPFAEGDLDRRFVWVSRDPADALLLRRYGVTALSLASPCETLGSKDGIERLAELKALTLARWCRGTLVVVDSLASLTQNGCDRLHELFEHVWQVRPDTPPADSGLTADAERPISLTGHGLSAILRTCTYPSSDRVADIESLLKERVREVGSRCARTVVRPQGAVETASTAGLTRPGSQSQNDPPPRLMIKTRSASKVLADNEAKDTWIVEPFAAPGRFTDLQGESFSGKTTFLLAMASAVAQGAAFLGKPCEKSDVVYITEQYEISFRDNLYQEKGSLDGVHLITHDDYEGASLPQIVELVKDYRREFDPRLVIFDTIYPIAGMEGGPSTSAGRVHELFRTLRPLAQDGAAVILVRHSNEGSGSLARTGSGSKAFSAIADYSFGLRKATPGTNLRTVTVESRRLGLGEFVVDRTPTGRYVLVGDDETGDVEPNTNGDVGGRAGAPVGQPRHRRYDHSELDADVRRVLADVEPPGIVATKIVKRLKGPDGEGPGRSTVDKSLQRLVKALQVVVVVDRSESGRAEYRYALARG